MAILHLLGYSKQGSAVKSANTKEMGIPAALRPAAPLEPQITLSGSAKGHFPEDLGLPDISYLENAYKCQQELTINGDACFHAKARTTAVSRGS